VDIKNSGNSFHPMSHRSDQYDAKLVAAGVFVAALVLAGVAKWVVSLF
jgi:hypothetical protein